jgi:hypothetical protein
LLWEAFSAHTLADTVFHFSPMARGDRILVDGDVPDSVA